ncbi:ribose import ATP-binding protein RbsA 2 [Sphaerisporangium rufum]|uniref:Ribose import ATP-binding protein RbsA 2 n=1 Tax=Sphaerisporangium rufum TaxID=1381558 RepID=A0A919V4D7_9ACTN|nr:ribose import ATP-binding protein RbsA 2 [Sphaerisporangium rufum]
MAPGTPKREHGVPVGPGERGAARPPLLSLRGITKSFTGVTALSQVGLDVREGTVHALVGENGAGKSTLMKVMAGVLQPDSGTIEIHGAAVRLHGPADARRRGISLVPQELSLMPHLSVAENIYLGCLPRRAGLVNRRALLRGARQVLERLGANVSPTSLLGEHGPAVQQLVMIARGIVLGGKVYILDEPTAALTDPEIERLFAVLRELQSAGAALVYVSHRLNEITGLADEVTVLRDGHVVQHRAASGVTEDELVRAMVGRSVERFFDRPGKPQGDSQPVLTVSGLTRRGVFEDVGFTVGAGEVVGLAGLVGAGRTEVARAIFGADPVNVGEITVRGRRARVRSPRDAIAAGIVLVPEERKTQGLILNLSISDNIALPHLRSFARGPFMRTRRLRDHTKQASERLRVKARSVSTAVGTLSGGNQQKVVLARWLTRQPALYILDEPTRGIDVEVKSEIYREIGRLADQGAGVLVISSELPELLGICDRILVMRQGRLVGAVPAHAVTEHEILEMAMGTGMS